jgi:hypothetical protein
LDYYKKTYAKDATTMGIFSEIGKIKGLFFDNKLQMENADHIKRDKHRMANAIFFSYPDLDMLHGLREYLPFVVLSS